MPVRPRPTGIGTPGIVRDDTPALLAATAVGMVVAGRSRLGVLAELGARHPGAFEHARERVAQLRVTDLATRRAAARLLHEAERHLPTVQPT